jgi:hypothetical protein
MFFLSYSKRSEECGQCSGKHNWLNKNTHSISPPAARKPWYTKWMIVLTENLKLRPDLENDLGTFSQYGDGGDRTRWILERNNRGADEMGEKAAWRFP